MPYELKVSYPDPKLDILVLFPKSLREPGARTPQHEGMGVPWVQGIYRKSMKLSVYATLVI